MAGTLVSTALSVAVVVLQTGLGYDSLFYRAFCTAVPVVPR